MTPLLSITFPPASPGVARLVGELDLDTAPRLLGMLTGWVETTGGTGLRISCAGITFIDSTGLHALCLVVERGAALGRNVTLTEPSRPVVRLLELTGLRDVLLAA